MKQKTVKRFGSWKSPITVDMLSAGTRFDDLAWSGSAGDLIWSEGKSGRNQLVISKYVPEIGGYLEPISISGESDVRAEIGYGGGAFDVRDHIVAYVEAKTAQIYLLDLKGQSSEADIAGELKVKLDPRRVASLAGKNANPRISPNHNWLLYINREDVASGGAKDSLAVAPLNERLHYEAAVDRDKCEAVILDQTFDFYRQIRWSHDSQYVAFIGWNHPMMPWVDSKVYLAKFIGGKNPRLGKIKQVSMDGEFASFQPEFSRDGKFLYYMCDSSGWGQLYAFDLELGSTTRKSKLDGECAQPNWVQEMRTFDLSPDGKYAYVACSLDARTKMIRICLSTGHCHNLCEGGRWTDISQIKVGCDGKQIAFIGSAPNLPGEVVVVPNSSHRMEGDRTVEGTELRQTLTLASDALSSDHKEGCPLQTLEFLGGGDSGLTSVQGRDQVFVMARSFDPGILPGAFSVPEHMSWVDESGNQIYGIYWPPTSLEFEGGAGELPPVVIKIHGGPTSQARIAWEPDAQFFTSRGIAVFHVNYRGSTGYGRSFMNALAGEWGVSDVEDAVSGLKNLVSRGLAHAQRTAIMGGSAGGYTVLQAMVRHPGVFSAGISLYGIGDLFALNEDTHKFEQYYNDYLIGSLPESDAKFYARSPKNFAGNIRRPIAIFQGAEDAVVLPSQAELIVAALKANNIPYIYHLYAGEGHGFRKRETKEHFYAAVIDFIGEHLR